MQISWKKKETEPKSNVDKILTDLIIADYKVKNASLALLSKLLYNSNSQNGVGRILLFRQSGLGDALTMLPAFSMIRNQYPDAEIDLLTNVRPDWQSGIDDILPTEFDRVYRYKHLFHSKLIKILLERQYDLFIVLPSYISSYNFMLRLLLFSKRIKAKNAFGWNVSSIRFLPKMQEKWFEFKPDSVRLTDLIASNGIARTDTLPETFNKGRNEHILSLINTYRLENKSKNIAIVIGAGRPQNKWPIANFIQVADYFSDQGYNLVMLGGKREKTEVEQFFRMKNLFNFCDELTPLESAEMLKKCLITITNDTGLMHISYTVGTPVVSIFSARDYSGKWFPPQDGVNIVLRNADVHCAICLHDNCVNNICMQKILPFEVISNAESLITKLSRLN